jgi:serine/threonine-protein kinase
MLEFQQQIDSETQLYIEDTDVPLAKKLNPNTRYAYFSTIAKGGKSIIKSCKDLHLGRTVCYKSLRPELIDNEVETRRLLREARISALLQHPNTVPTYEVGRDSRGNYYFTMKLIHGYTLREVLNYRERYDLDQLMDVILHVGNALAYAHSRGVVHRDIKPENILIGPYGETLLLDWGLAKVWHKNSNQVDGGLSAEEVDADPGMTGEGKLQGTVMYMSPEQIRRDPSINSKSDLYSLGAVLYETLTGVTPFQGKVVRELLEQVKHETPKPPQDVTGIQIPSVLADLCMQCLEKDPSKRPESAGELVRILKEDWHR